MSDDLIGLGGFTGLLAAAADDFLQLAAERFFGHFITTDFLDEFGVECRDGFLFDAFAIDGEGERLAAQAFKSEIFRQVDGEGAVFVFFDADESGVEAREEVLFSIEQEPVFGDFLEMIRRVGHDLGEGLPIETAFAGEHDGVAMGGFTFDVLE